MPTLRTRTTKRSPSHSSSTPSAAPLPSRMMSLDALRGFNLFWIMGAETLFAGLQKFSSSRPILFLARQLDHTEWDGFTFYDLIFPLFLFIAGVSLAISFDKTREKHGADEACKHLILR